MAITFNDDVFMDRSFENNDSGLFIYICCSLSDRERIFPVVGKLYRQGWNVWCGLSADEGMSLSEDCANKIERCKTVVFFVTNESAKDSFLADNELALVNKLGKPVVVCVMDLGAESPAIVNCAAVTDADSLDDTLRVVNGLERGSSDCAPEWGYDESGRLNADDDIYMDMDAPSYDFDCMDGADCSAGPGGWMADSSVNSMPQPSPMPEPDFISMSNPMPAPPHAVIHAKKRATEQSTKVKPVRVDKVSFSALAPEKAEKGTYSTVSVYMYTKSQRKVVDKAIKAAKQAVSETTKGGFKVGRGNEVTIELHSDDVKVKDNRETRVWNGGSETFDFMFYLPEDYGKKQIAFTCYVYFNGVQITRLNFVVALKSAGKRALIKVKRRDHRHIFVSYCGKDRQRVIAQLLAIQEIAPRMTFWMDKYSLQTGDNWRKEIKKAIDNADSLFLFWSMFARESSEVEKEWRYALSSRGIRFITPVPLDPVNLCLPPEELSSCHFDHSSFYEYDNIEDLNFRSSRRIRVIG